MELTKFDELETKVLALVDRAQELAGRNEELALSLEKTELDLVTAMEQIESLEKERAMVLEKVDTLLNRIGQPEA